MSSTSVAQATSRGSFILFAGNFVSTGILTIATIVIARLLGPPGYGAYTLVFLAPSILTLFVGLGVGTAVTRYVAFSLSTGEREKAASMTRTAILFTLMFGLALSGLNFLAAPYFVSAFLHRPELIQYVWVSSIYVAAVTVAQTATSALIGWNSMTQVSLYAILQALLKLTVGAGLVLAGFGVYGAVVGHVASYIIQGAVACIAIYVLRIRVPIGAVSHFLEEPEGDGQVRLSSLRGKHHPWASRSILSGYTRFCRERHCGRLLSGGC